MRDAARQWLTGWLGRPRFAELFAAFAVFALLVRLLSTDPVHRIWATWAAAAYLAAAVTAGAWRTARGIWAAAWVSLAGALAGPLAQLAVTGRNLPEVTVIENAGALLLHHGSPYETPAQLAGASFIHFDPYLPAMTVFGLPHAIFGGGLLTDPRVWAAVAFAGLCWLALRIAGTGHRAGYLAVIAIASPVFAFPLAVSGNDLPVIGLLCLSLALAAPTAAADSGRPVLAGLVLGLASAMKATAWLGLPVIGALILIRGGWRDVGKFAAAAAAVLAATVGPWLITAPRSLLENTIEFPLGLAGVKSPAASPLPGHLLAATGQAGHAAAVVLLAIAGLAVAVSIVVRPPGTLAAATYRLALGLALMFTLAPATRWGYYVYPAGLCCWLWLAGRTGPAERRPAPAAGGHAAPGPALDGSGRLAIVRPDAAR